MRGNAPSIDPALLGRTRDSEEFRVNRRRLAQFAEALGAEEAALLEGRIAHPVFTHVPTMQSLVEVVQGVAPGAPVLHGEHDFQFHRPTEPGQRLFTATSLIGLRQSRAGAVLTVRSQTATDEGDLVTTQTAVCVLPDARVVRSAGLGGARPRDSGIAPRDSRRIDLPMAQAVLYAEAARDYSPYTLEAEAARSLGFEAPILHGMCTLGLATNAVMAFACPGAPGRLVRLGCRFSAPLLMRGEQSLETRLYRVEEGDLIGFDCLDAIGATVISKGYARLRR